jgi:murein DD-endopeptidase MepM/ murein hydrolase activator NlpD
MALSPRVRVSLVSAGILLALAALVWYLSTMSRSIPVTPITPPATSELPNPTGDANRNDGAFASPSNAPPTDGVQSPTPSPSSEVASPSPSSTASSPAPMSSAPQTSPTVPAANSANAGALLIPVVGVSPQQLQDTYTQSRSEGRTHNAIDIMAPRNTPVVAAADGQIIKLFNSERGGITLYQLGTDNRTVYYYAHLERYADGITENRFARRGELLGYVGDSGNAGRDNCHLHFSIWLVTDPKRFWDGENINPYPLLTKR